MLNVLRKVSLRRWAVAAVVFTMVAGVAQICLAASNRTPKLHVQASLVADQLVITQVETLGIAWFAGIQPGAVVTQIDDRPVASSDTPDTINRATALQVRNLDGQLLQASLTILPEDVSLYRHISFPLIAASFIMLGLTVFMLAADLRIGVVVLSFGVSAALTLLASLATLTGTTWAFAVVYIGLVCSGASTLLLFLLFPINRLNTRFGQLAAMLCLGISVLLLALYSWTINAGPTGYYWLRNLMLAVLLLDLLGTCVLVVIALIRIQFEQRVIRRVMNLVALGVLGGVGPFCLLVLIPRIFGWEALLPLEVATTCFVLLPLGLGAAVLSRQFFGINRLAQRGLVALVVWVSLVLMYATFFNLLKRVPPSSNMFDDAFLDTTVLQVALVAGTFPLLQHYLRQYLEQTLFGRRYDHVTVLHDLSNTITQLTGIENIATTALTQMGHILAVDWVILRVEPEGETFATYRWDHQSAQAVVVADAIAPPLDEAAQEIFAHLPLLANGIKTGTLLIGPKQSEPQLLLEDRLFLNTFTPLLGTALHNALLLRRLEQQVALLGEREEVLAAFSARLIDVQEEERYRIALDIHDDPLQRAVLLERSLAEELALPQARRWHWAVEEIIISLRSICMGMRPPMLDDFGLIHGLEWLINDVRARTDLVVEFLVETDDQQPFGRLSIDLEVALYRVVQEALNNCCKHAHATHVTVTLWRKSRSMGVSIRDNGRGDVPTNGTPASRRFGIIGMRERIRPWGGTLKIDSLPEGGLLVAVDIPLRESYERAA